MIGFNFASDRSRGWRQFTGPITDRREGKPLQSRINFNAQLKIGQSFCTVLLVYFNVLP